MSLICILISLIFDRISPALEPLRNLSAFDYYNRWWLNVFPTLNTPHIVTISFLLLPIMAGIFWFQTWIDGRMMSLPDLLFGLITFAFCLGPLDLNRQINHYLEARKNADEQAANLAAEAIMGKPASSSADQQVVEVMRAILHEANDRMFAVIFWFVLLGPFGALLYRLTSHAMHSAHHDALQQSAKQLQAILAWAPAHLAAMGYALTGNYEGAKQEFYNKTQQDDLFNCNYHTLITAGQGALVNCQAGEEIACIRSTRALVLRTLIVWLGIIAILTLLGWAR